MKYAIVIKEYIRSLLYPQWGETYLWIGERWSVDFTDESGGHKASLVGLTQLSTSQIHSLSF